MDPRSNLQLNPEYLDRIAKDATERSRRNPFHAEAREASANWYVLVTHQNHEGVAAAHLTARRFGTYLPTEEIEVISHGAKRVRSYLLFPGYVFLFAWNIDHNWRRICTCPGVADILRSGESPAVLPDHEMEKIQKSEWKLFMDGKDWSGPKRKRGKRGKFDISQPCVVTISTKSYLENVAAVDSAQRISLLHKALGLP